MLTTRGIALLLLGMPLAAAGCASDRQMTEGLRSTPLSPATAPSVETYRKAAEQGNADAQKALLLIVQP
jgi:hypothetical protein